MKGEPSYGKYFAVFAALLVLTFVTWAVSYQDMGVLNVVVALIIASVKASLVALYFMHLRYEKSGLVFLFAGFPLAILLLIVAGTLSDTLFR
ncbi:MAG TPA: cytochrome C oxidase subunit IV family protein [Nitrospirota bacterium]|jgi:cytochrome c oxidase subunit 4